MPDKLMEDFQRFSTIQNNLFFKKCALRLMRIFELKYNFSLFSELNSTEEKKY